MADASKIKLTLGDAPSIPPAGTIFIYGKSDKTFYAKDSDGVEVPLEAAQAVGTGDGPTFDHLHITNAITAATAYITTLDTNVAAAGVTLSGTTLAADGTDAAIDITITPKGTGSVVMSKVDINAGAIDGTAIGANAAAAITCTTLNTGGKLTAGANEIECSNVDFTGGTITGITDLTVPDGGTGASTLADHCVLLGSGTDAITPMTALGAGEIIVGVAGA